MAAPLVLTAAQQELISSLTQDEIPIKLRCAIDSRLAVNACRLPCCDQSICETCHATLPSTCPVCEHSPVSAADCKPNKSLRTTIKVFLRTEEKKRETARSKEVQESLPVTPIVDVPPTPVEVISPVEPEAEASAQEEAAIVEETPLPADASALVEDGTNGPGDEIQPEVNADDQDVPHATIEEISQDQEPVETDGDANAVSDDNKNGVVQLNASEGQEDGESGTENAAAGFPGMMGGDMNQMQMFMAMQNGMGPGAFGGFPMMGMPGMGMDPMSMQNMFMNGGFGAGGMGMNGMNMGMGMGGFNGGGGNGFNNWNTQQNSWNVGQDNFNHPNASGMMGHGDYRSNNSGFAQGASGFNQGNYGRSQYNDFNNHGYGNNNFGARGRGRGRGGFGRGGFQHQDFSHQQQNFGQNQNFQSETRESIPAEVKPAEGVDEYGRELRPATEPRDSGKPEDANTAAEKDAKNENILPRDSADAQDQEHQEHQDSRVDYDDATPMPIQSFEQSNNSYNQHNGGYGHNNAYSQQYGNRNGFNSMQPPAVKPDVPINAPTGPKAMREGLPNVGFRRGQFIPQPVQQTIQTNGSTNGSVRAESEVVADRQRSRSPSRERSRERSYDGEKSRDKERSRSREHRHRRHRHRSESVSEDEKETQRRRERRRERRRRREEEETAREQGDEQYPEDGGEKQDPEEEVVDRSRSASPSEHKRSSHRSSRREKEKYRDRERDSEKDREHKSSSRRHRSHRSHREDRSRSRDRDRERDKDREHRRRHSRREEVPEENDGSIPITPVEESESTSRKQSIVSTANGLEIKGVSFRRRAQEQQPLDAPAIPTGPRSDREKEKARSHNTLSSRHQPSEKRSSRDNPNHSISSKAETKATPSVDPHTLERQARDRERILKEAQRMAFTGGGARKRSRDDVTDGGVDGKERRGSRKKGRRGGVVEEDEEGRIARLEAEREAARWS